MKEQGSVFQRFSRLLLPPSSACSEATLLSYSDAFSLNILVKGHTRCNLRTPKFFSINDDPKDYAVLQFDVVGRIKNLLLDSIIDLSRQYNKNIYIRMLPGLRERFLFGGLSINHVGFRACHHASHVVHGTAK